MTKIENDQEELFAQFLRVNKIIWDEKNKKSYEQYGDFYFPNEDIMIELKSLHETEISKVLKKQKANYVVSLPFNDSFSSVSNHLADANTKALRARSSKKYKNSIFITLISIVNGFDMKVHLFVGNLQGMKFLNYPLVPYEGRFFDEEKREYFITEKQDDNDLLRETDYIGLLRKTENFSKWRIELVERPFYGKRQINLDSPLGKFIDIWKPNFIC